MFKLIKRLLVIGTIASLLTLNILTITSSLVFDSLSGILSTVTDKLGRPELMVNSPSKRETKQLKAARAENQALKQKSLARQAKVKNIGHRITRRTARNAAMHITSAAGEAVPYVGAAVVIGALGMEVYDSCKTLEDMEEMLTAFEIDTDETTQERTTVCAQEVPTVDEISASVKAGWQSAYTASANAIQEAATNTGQAIKGTTDIAIESASLKVAAMRESVGAGIGKFVEGSKSRWKATTEVIGETTHKSIEASKGLYNESVNFTSGLIESALH